MKRCPALMTLCLIATAAQAGPKGPMPVITHYEMKTVVMIDQNRLSSACRMTVRNTTDKPHRTVWLLLNPGLRAMEDTVFVEGEPQKFRQREIGLEGYATYRINRVSIALGKWLEPGDSTTVQLNYYGPIDSYAHVLSYLRDAISDSYTLIRDESFTYPMMIPPSYEALWGKRSPFTYDIEVTAPQGYVVACGGRRVAVRSDDESVKYTFHSEMPTQRMAIAVAKFDVTSDQEKRLTVYALPENEMPAANAVDLLETSIGFYTRLFGRPQHDHGFTLIDLPDEWGSQSGDAYFLQPLPAFGTQNGKRRVYRHVAHQWTAEAKPAVDTTGWFHTAFTTYFEALAVREFEGQKPYVDFLEDKRDHFAKRVESDAEIGLIPMAEFDSPRLARNTATKGTFALYVLHRLVGEEGFRKIVSTFLEKHAGKQVDFRDFQESAQRAADIDLTRFFNDWIYGAESSELLVNQKNMDDILARYR